MGSGRRLGSTAMRGGTYEIRPLTRGQVDQAFPLVREIAGSLSIGQWQCYARRLLAAGQRGARHDSGIIAAHGPRALYLRGLFTYRTLPDLIGRDRLVAGCFAVPGTIDRTAIARALIEACRITAEAAECRTIQVDLVERNQWLAALLCDAGFEADSSSFLRTVSGHEQS
jgi:hypothetical protein